MWKLGLLALFISLAGPAAAEPPMWIVRDADSEMVLFGTLHVLPPGLDWTPPRLTQALAKADDVWFELGVDAATQAELGQAAQTRGFLPPGQSLTALLSPEAKARLTRLNAKFGVPDTYLDRLQPWYAEVALAWMGFRLVGADVASGVEEQLSARVPPTAARRALETPAQQIALFADAPQAEQVASFELSLKETEDLPDQLPDLVKAWMSGDPAAVDKQVLGPLRKSSPALFKRLITDRNAHWTEVLKARLDGSGRTVVAVGLGHMVGPGGVPARLRALGYSVEGP